MKFRPRTHWFGDQEFVLARVHQRFFAILIDMVIVFGLLYLALLILDMAGLKIENVKLSNFKEIDLETKDMSETSQALLKLALGLIPTFYFALANYFTNGRTVGKALLRIRVVSLYHKKIGLWHCIERSLGYVASTLEASLGFFQVFWNPNRMALHDRIAETIVVSIPSKKLKVKRQATESQE